MRLARDGIVTLGGAGQPDRLEAIAVEYTTRRRAGVPP